MFLIQLVKFNTKDQQRLRHKFNDVKRTMETQLKLTVPSSTPLPHLFPILQSRKHQSQLTFSTNYTK